MVKQNNGRGGKALGKGWARSLVLHGVNCPRERRWGGDRGPCHGGSPELGRGGDGLYLCVILCCQVSCAGGGGVHSATVLRMTLDLISFSCLSISWISLQTFKLAVIGWAVVPFLQATGGTSFNQKCEEDKLPVLPAQSWHLSSLWTPQDSWVLVGLPAVPWGGCQVWEEGRDAPNLLAVVSVPEILWGHHAIVVF